MGKRKRKHGSIEERKVPSLELMQGNISSTLLLEEQNHSEQIKLKALNERKEEISKELHAARINRQNLLKRQVHLQERRLHLKAQKLKDQAFLKGVQKSLSKSKAQLLRRAVDVESSKRDCGPQMEGESSEAQNHRSERHINGDKPHTNQMADEIDNKGYKQVGNEMEVSASDNATPGGSVDLKTGSRSSTPPSKTNMERLELWTMGDKDVLQTVHSGFRHPKGLMNFCRGLKRPVLENILILAMREANASEGAECSPNARRRLLWHTCLDFSVVACNVFDGNSNEPIDPRPLIDPNISVCQNEFESGFCNDKFCPYQHTKKKTLPREMIPLPPFQGLKRNTKKFVRKGGDRERSNQKTTKFAISSKNLAAMIPTIVAPSDDAVGDNFISLPVANEVDTDSIDSDGDSGFDEASDEDNFDDTPVESTPSENKQILLQWGGIIDMGSRSFIDLIANMSNVLAKSDSVLVPTEVSPENASSITDCVRIALFAGRYDVAVPVSNVALRMLSRPVDAFIRKLYATISRRVANFASFDSFFLGAFHDQVALALISIYHEAHQVESSLKMSVSRRVIEECLQLSTVVAQKKRHDKRKPAIRDLEAIFRETTELNSRTRSSIFHQLQHLRHCLDWAAFFLPLKVGSLKSIEEIQSDVLMPTWKLCIKLLENEDLISSRFVLNVSILMGYVINTAAERYAESSRNDSLDLSTWMSLVEMNSMIYQILTTLVHKSKSVPLVQTVLGPIIGLHIAMTAFVQKYDLAQERLVQFLEISEHQNEFPTLLRFSDLLWSQLFQLRMALRPSEIKDRKRQQRTKTKSKSFAWEVSKKTLRVNRLLLDTVDAYGVHLNYVSLEGDWILTHAINGNFPPPFTCIKKPARLKPSAFKVSKLIFGEASEEEMKLDMKRVGFSHRLDGSGRQPTPFLSSLPWSIMLAGECVVSLDFSSAELHLLPATFGLYFPNLITLNLEKNRLKTVPISFQKMLRLENLVLAKNELDSLSGEALSASLKILDISRNSLTDLPLTFWETLGRRCFQLEEINFSHNLLGNKTSEIHDVVPRIVAQLKNLDTIQWDCQGEPSEDGVITTNGDVDEQGKQGTIDCSREDRDSSLENGYQSASTRTKFHEVICLDDSDEEDYNATIKDNVRGQYDDADLDIDI